MTEDKEEQQKQRLSDGGEKKQANEREQTEKAARAAKKAAAAKAKVCPQRAAKKDEEKPLEPSPNEPVLDAYVAKIRAACGEDAVEDSSINRANDHMPTIRVKRDKWLDVAKLLRDDKELAFDYLIDLTAYDDDDFMSVVTHLYSFPRNAYLTVHVHTERDGAWVPSVTSVWPAANWNERETYDMFGIQFKGHPNLTRILMSDDWVGYPLRKDYVPLDGEV